MTTKMVITIPTEVKHYHKGNGRLIATTVSVPVENGKVAVGICRVNKSERKPSRKFGRTLAETRLRRGLGIFTGTTDKQVALHEQDMKLFTVMTAAEYQDVIKTNPFKKWACVYGTDEQARSQYIKSAKTKLTKPKKTAKKAVKKTSRKKK